MIDLAALQMVLGVQTGWLARRARAAVAYLIEENRLLRRQLGGCRLGLTDEDRRRRFVRSIKEECLDRLIAIGERRQSPHLGPAGDQDDESRAPPSAARRVAQCL